MYTTLYNFLYRFIQGMYCLAKRALQKKKQKKAFK